MKISSEDIGQFDVEDFNNHFFAYSKIPISSSFYKQKPRKYSKDEVRRMLLDPENYSKELQSVSQYLVYSNGHFNRVLQYFTNMLTLDYVLYPKFTKKKIESMDSEKLKDLYIKNADYCYKMNIKYNYRWFMFRLFVNGELFLYKLEDKDSIIYKEIPPEFCQITLIEDSVFRYSVDLSKLSSAYDLEDLPIEFQEAIILNNKNKKSSANNNWYQVSNLGFAFATDASLSLQGVPPLSFMFDAIMGYEDLLDEIEDNEKANSFKLVHQKIPLDENYQPVMERKTAQAYHDAAASQLPKNVSLTTNPFDIKEVSFDRANRADYSSIQYMEESVYSTGGVSKLLFNNNTNSGEGLKKSIQVDEMYVYKYLSQFQNYINFELKNYNKVNSFAIDFLESTYFNIDDKHALYREDLAFGGSRTMFLAAIGLEPYQSMNLLITEQKIGIDELFSPVKSSYTTSPSTTSTSTNDVSDTADKERSR
jgi:hypothetical protein